PARAIRECPAELVHNSKLPRADLGQPNFFLHFDNSFVIVKSEGGEGLQGIDVRRSRNRYRAPRPAAGAVPPAAPAYAGRHDIQACSRSPAASGVPRAWKPRGTLAAHP